MARQDVTSWDIPRGAFDDGIYISAKGMDVDKADRWEFDDGSLWVQFHDGTILYKKYNPYVSYEPSLLDRIKRWLGL